MNIDDQEMVDKTGRLGIDVFTERFFYIGGIDFIMLERLVAFIVRFFGCMFDFIINGK